MRTSNRKMIEEEMREIRYEVKKILKERERFKREIRSKEKEKEMTGRKRKHGPRARERGMCKIWEW